MHYIYIDSNECIILVPRKPVSNVKCEPYNSTAILVTWDPIPETDFSILQGKLLGYVVRYWRHDLDENLNYWRKRFLGQRGSAIIIGLEPDTVYFVREADRHSVAAEGNKRFLCEPSY